MARSPETLLRKGKIRRYRLIFFRLEPLKTPQPWNFSSPIFARSCTHPNVFWYQRPKCVIYPPLFCCKSHHEGLGLGSVISVHIYYLSSGVQTSTSEQSCSSNMLSWTLHSGFTIFVNFGRLLKFKKSLDQNFFYTTKAYFYNFGIQGSLRRVFKLKFEPASAIKSVNNAC